MRIPDNWLDNDLRSQIWRYEPLTDKWSKVFTSPMVRGIEGFDVPLSLGFRCMTSFQGLSDSAPALYVPTWGTYCLPTTFMLRSGDGINFEVVSEPGTCIPNHRLWGLRGLVSFKDHLFTSPAAGKDRHEPNVAGFTAVLVSEDPVRGEWKLACEPYLGNPNNLSVFQMAVFNGYLYAGTLNINEGYQVWKTDANGELPFKWEKILSHGAYRGKLNQIAMTLTPFKDCLYIGSGIQHGGFDFDNNLGPGAPELIRINPDDSWDLVVGEPRITPDGFKVPLSGLGPGFGNPFAGYIWSMCVHEGWLYAGTAVWSAFLRYTKTNSWPDGLRHIFTPENIERLLHKFGGCDLWRTRDGYNWLPVTLNGFDNCCNIGFRNMVSSPYGIFVGAANSFAPEVAVKRVAGWNYEYNPKGGLEIWLGSHDPANSRSSTSNYLSNSSICLTEEHITDNIQKSDRDFLENMVDKFYGYSGFRHFGYWRVDINNARVACENLMDEILAFISEKKGTIVDIGCGLGTTTQYLLKYFPSDRVTGISSDKRALKACQERVPEVKFLYRKLPDLDLPAESVDSAIWAKGHDSFGSRNKLLLEIFGILKPGGQLVSFDILRTDVKRSGILKKIWDIHDQVRTPEEYRDLLSETGFENIRIFDVTSESLVSFRRYIERFFGLKRLSGEIDIDTLMNIEAYLLMDDPPIYKCLLISGYKPVKEQKRSQES